MLYDHMQRMSESTLYSDSSQGSYFNVSSNIPWKTPKHQQDEGIAFRQVDAVDGSNSQEKVGMERHGSASSGISGIRVDREIVVQSDSHHGESLGISAPPSVTSAARSFQDLPNNPTGQKDEATGTSRAMARSPQVRTIKYGDHLLDDGRSERSDSGVQYLIEFLQNTPPPDNGMSVPDGLSIAPGSDEHKWGNFKLFKRRKKPKRKKYPKPPVIKLPDSAVAAKTTGGHRHIAISIPVEHSHHGPTSPTQYPIFGSVDYDWQSDIDLRLSPNRGYNTDRHLVTVLKPVAEDLESMSELVSHPMRNSRPAGRSTATGAEELSPHSLPSSGAPNIPQMARISRLSLGQKLQEAFDVGTVETPNPPKRQKSDHSRPESISKENLPRPRTEPSGALAGGLGHNRNKSSASKAATIAPISTATQHPPPSRRSSRKAKTSVDLGNTMPSVRISQASISNAGEAGRPDILRPGSWTEKTQVDVKPHQDTVVETTVSVTVNDGEDKGGKTSTKEAPCQNVALIVPPKSPSQIEMESPLVLNFPTPPSGGVNVSVQTEDDPAGSSAEDKLKSRKDRVRERKQRDMEAIRARRISRESGTTVEPGSPSSTSGQFLKPATVDREPESPVLGHFSELGSSAPSRVGSPTPTGARRSHNLSPIKVEKVADLNMPRLSPTAILESAKKPAGLGGSPATTLPSPPSTPGSPAISYDRTSSQRRKERQVEREALQTRRARYTAKAMAEERETTERLTRNELLQRYESLKESRIYDMEKRLRRLERNGEVMLRSLVPMMESLNQFLQEQQPFQSVARAHAQNSAFHTAYQRSPPHGQRSHRPKRTESVTSQVSLRPFRTVDSQGEEHSSNEKSKTRPPSIRISESKVTGDRAKIRASFSFPIAPSNRPPVPSPLQAEYEKDFMERLTAQHRNEALNQLIRSHSEGYVSNESSKRAGDPNTEGDADGDAGTGGECEGDTSDLDHLDPLIRELHTGSRISLERPPEERLHADEREAFALY